MIKLKNLKARSSDFEITPRTVISLLLLVILIISLTLYFTSNFRRTDRIFFFPDSRSGNTIGEARKIPRIPFDREKNMEIFVKELLLGPMSINLDPLFSTGTRLEKILFRNKIVYLDLNFMALLPDKRAVHDFSSSIMLVEKNIKFNFPFVENVIITILGQVPEIGL
ncbi:MAG: hypothetical protein FWD87_06285 [Spirochaetaceae bacterium]|nr:hypothetical protein [Spirochaetaceae bacterium]